MEGDRGQLMLVGAITIAVIFLGLVAVLNTGLYTSNVAPRAGLSATADAETFVDGVEQDVPTLLGAAAEESVAGEVYAFDAVIDREVNRYGSYLLRSVAEERAATVGITLNGTTYGNGWLVVDDDASTEFDPADSENLYWTVAEDVDDTNGTITLYRFPADNDTENARFALEADGDGGDEWRLETYWEDDSGGQVHIVVSGGGGCTFPQEQPTNASGITIDLTAGNVREVDCSFTRIDEALDDQSYDLWVERSGAGDDTRARGTYGIAVEGTTEGEVHDGDVVEGGPSVTDVPYSVPRLDAATLTLQYTAPSLDYDTDIRIDPAAVDLPAPPLIGTGVVFVDESSGYLRSSDEDENIDAFDPARIGPAEVDFDADGRVEIPHVSGSDTIRLIDVTNESTTLPSGDIDTTGRSRLAVGTWNGSPVSVFYAGDGTINRTTPGARSPVRLNATAAYGVRAPVGPADIDNDGSTEFVYVDGGGTLRALENASDTDPERVGSDGLVSGGGVGPAHDFDGDGAASIPFVDDDGNVTLIDGTGSRIDLFAAHGISDGDPVDAASMAVRDVNDDGDAEIVYLRSGRPYFLENVGNGSVREQLLEPDGDLGSSDTVDASEEQGVA